MPWILLVLAGLFEVGWAIGLKYTDGFTKLWPTVGTIAAMAISLGLLGIAMKSLPVGTAYAIWVGVGAVGTVILGIVLFHEPMNALRMISVGLIIAGLIGLKLASPRRTLLKSRMKRCACCIAAVRCGPSPNSTLVVRSVCSASRRSSTP